MADDFDLKGEELYRDESVRIHAHFAMVDEHEAVVGGNYLLIPQGVLREWAKAPIDLILSDYRNLRAAGCATENLKVPIEQFARACSIARIRELEEAVNFVRRIDDLPRV